MLPLEPEFANTSSRLLVALLLDVSSSMAGDPIEKLCLGISGLKELVECDDQASDCIEICIITFGRKIECTGFHTVDQWVEPVLVADGLTPTITALEVGLEEIKNRKDLLQSHGITCRQPAWMVLITDGFASPSWWLWLNRHPTPKRNLDQVTNTIHELTAKKNLRFLGIGSNDSSLEMLNMLSAPEKAYKIGHQRFEMLFDWITRSIIPASRAVEPQFLELPPREWED